MAEAAVRDSTRAPGGAGDCCLRQVSTDVADGGRGTWRPQLPLPTSSSGQRVTGRKERLPRSLPET